MEPNNQNQYAPAPQEPQSSPRTESAAPEKSSTGAIIGSVIVILVLIIGGFYFWGKKLNEKTPEETGAVIQSLSSSDEAEVIESELGETDIDDLNLDLDIVLDAEL